MSVRILGIETSCDETATGIVVDGRRIKANRLATQFELHREFGGVVPEIAARAHLRAVRPLVEATLAEAQLDLSSLDAIAVTYGPGLAGCLLVGVNLAKALAYVTGLPLLGINHLEGHVYANWLHETDPQAAPESIPPEPSFPLLCLVVSGGHTDLVLMEDHSKFRRIGQTVDDAAGEAFDKVARMLGLGFPGGPALQRAAENGNPKAFEFPRARTRQPYDFSFSGLKTAVLRTLEALGENPPIADLAASFQEAVVDAVATKVAQAADELGVVQVAIGGGVSANRALRERVERLSPVPVYVPPPKLCTDNGAMIAAAAYRRFLAGERAALDLDILPNLPLA